MCQKLENSQRLFRFIIYLIFNELVINEKFYFIYVSSLLVYVIYSYKC